MHFGNGSALELIFRFAKDPETHSTIGVDTEFENEVADSYTARAKAPFHSTPNLDRPRSRFGQHEAPGSILAVRVEGF